MDDSQTSFKQYKDKDVIECRPYVEGEDLDGVTIAGLDRQMGSPKAGDVIARLPKNHQYQWLIASECLDRFYDPVGSEG